MQIDICNQQDGIKIDRTFIRHSAKKVLQILNEANAELSICFMDNIGIKRLNNRFRHKDIPTDVLAFPMRKNWPKGTNILGDVVISLETAKSEAKKRKKPLKEEVLLYLVHGILHLLGCNDQTTKGRLAMRRKEREILRKVIRNSSSFLSLRALDTKCQGRSNPIV